MNRGQLVLAPFAYSDLLGSKRRPACVVSAPAFNVGPDVVLAMITSNAALLRHPGTGDVVVADWRVAGLPLPSVVRTGRLLVIERRLVFRTLGSLAALDLAAVDEALKTVFGLR